MSLKILSVCLSNAFGGLEKYSVALALGQAARGHEVLLLCRKGSGTERMAMAEGLAHRSFSYRRYIDLPLMWRIRKIAVEGGFRLAHAHKSDDLGIVAPALWNLPGVPLFFSLHMNVPGPKKDLYHRLEYGRVAKIFANGAVCADSARRNLPVQPEKVLEVPYGLDVSLYPDGRNPSLRRELNIADDAPLLGVLSRLEPLKGQMDAVRAMPAVLEKFPKAVLLLVGDATVGQGESEKQRIEKTARELGITERVKILPFQKDVPRALGALDVFLLPSHFETYSISLIEAKLCGVPVVAAATGGVPQNLGEGAFGLLVPPQDPPALARGIIETLSDAERAKGRAEKARADALQRHDMGRVLDVIESEYRLALGPKNG